MSDWELIQLYAKSRSESAFAELVRRHLAWVYSVALRQVRQPQLAEEVAQSVFVLLARKAGDLRSGTILGGWLFRTTRFVGSRALRAEQRQKNREQAVSSMTPAITFPQDYEAAWEELAPHLDKAVANLSEQDRAAILLRFYERKSLQEVGDQFGISEEAAKKRVSRAVGKLRGFLNRRRVTIGGAVLVTVLAQKTVEAVPVALEASVVKVAFGASLSTTLPHLAHETLAAWKWAKVKLAAGLAAGSLALILVVLTSGLFMGHRGSEPASLNALPQAQAGDQAQNVFPAQTVPAPTQVPQKVGALTGLVVDEQGHPVSGAKVWGGFSSVPYARDVTDANGQFALQKVAAPPYVTVTADGFAADQQEFDPTNAGQLVFRLSPVQPLNVHVADEAGQGVPGVSLFLANWWGRVGTLAQHLPQQTDADGRLQWLSAPKGELEVQFGKEGYSFSRTNKLFADGEAHTIVLHPAATVTGTVTDAETGVPVASFKFTPGHSQPWNPADPTPMWELHSIHDGSNGFYKLAIDEEQVPYLRIEADGYETVETQIQLSNRLEAVCDFRLKPQTAADSIRGTVLLPDGSPAVDVDVALCTPQAGVMLTGTAFEPGAFGNINKAQSSGYRTKTDDQGSFAFDPKPGAHTVVAVSLAGLGQVRCFDSSKPLIIHLQRWGRVEGSVRTRDGQWAGRKVIWVHPGNLTSWNTLYYDSKGFSAFADETGKFTLEYVPPGDGRVGIDDGPGVAAIFSRSIRVNPGEAVQVQVGGVGRGITGKLVTPSGLEIRSWSNQVTLAQLHVQYADYHIPEGLRGSAVERWKLEFEDTEDGRNWFRDQYSYDFQVGADGSFTIPEVLPGRYRLFIAVGQGYLGSGQDAKPSTPGDPRIAFAGQKITVPEVSGEDASPLDLGDISLIADR